MPRAIGTKNGRPKKGSRKIIKSTPKMAGHPKGRGAMVGAVERLDEKTLRAHHLKANGYYLHEIAEMIGREFQCKAPHPATICVWISKWESAFFDEIKDIQKGMRQQQYFELQLLKRKWLLLAAIENLQITKYVKQDGETVPVVDENAWNEQTKAAMIALKIQEREAKLFGIDLQLPKEGDGPQRSPQELFLFFQQQINMQPGEKQLEVLEITDGEPDKI